MESVYYAYYMGTFSVFWGWETSVWITRYNELVVFLTYCSIIPDTKSDFCYVCLKDYKNMSVLHEVFGSLPER